MIVAEALWVLSFMLLPIGSTGSPAYSMAGQNLMFIQSLGKKSSSCAIWQCAFLGMNVAWWCKYLYYFSLGTNGCISIWMIKQNVQIYSMLGDVCGPFLLTVDVIPNDVLFSENVLVFNPFTAGLFSRECEGLL